MLELTAWLVWLLALVCVLEVLRDRRVRGRAELALLELLADEQWWFGLDLVQRSGGRLQRGTVYVHLSKLEDRGVVISREELEVRPHIGIARRQYRLACSSPRGVS